MGRIIRPILTTVLLWSVILTQAATAQTFPDRANTYINDYADLLTTDQEQDLLRTLTELRQNRDIEMTVLTIKRRSDYQQPLTNEAFATALFNHWGIGDRDRNDGILFLVSRLDRDMRIEVGTGYGSKHDAGLKTIIDRVIIQKFRLDNYVTGIVDGVDHTIREIAGVWPGQYDANPVVRWWTDLRIWAGGFIFAIFAPIGWLIWRAYHAAKRRAPRRCPVDGSWMPRVLDEFEDKHLTDGQQKEEKLASKEYDVWICRDCDHVTISGFRRWFSGKKLCRECGYHTLESERSVTTKSPTRYSTGSQRTDFKCHHCAAEYTVNKTLPVLPPPSSGGGGSFGGGGSSSGGGASGSW